MHYSYYDSSSSCYYHINWCLSITHECITSVMIIDALVLMQQTIIFYRADIVLIKPSKIHAKIWHLLRTIQGTKITFWCLGVNKVLLGRRYLMCSCKRYFTLHPFSIMLNTHRLDKRLPLCNATKQTIPKRFTLKHYNMKPLSVLLVSYEGHPLVSGEFSSRRTSDAGLWYIFTVILNLLLNKQSSCRWFQMPYHSCEVSVMKYLLIQ